MPSDITKDKVFAVDVSSSYPRGTVVKLQCASTYGKLGQTPKGPFYRKELVEKWERIIGYFVGGRVEPPLSDITKEER